MGNLFSGPSQKYKPHQSHLSSDPDHLRQQGDQLAQERNELFARSQAAYHAGDHKGAKLYSIQAKQKDQQLKQLHAKAAEIIYQNKNAHRTDGCVDLHGLRVTEAVQVVEDSIIKAKSQGRKELVFITGQGLHSKDGIPKLKPAIEKLIDKHNLRCIPEKPNKGCLTVQFVSAAEKGWLHGVLEDACVIC